jgi:hypothetical protein
MTAFALVLPLTVPCWAAQVRELPTQTRTVSGTIETIDQSKRAMNIKTADGEFVAVYAPPDVTRFDQLKVGNHVTATYNNYVMARLKSPGEADINTGDSNYTRDTTSGKQEMTRTMTATIVAIDKAEWSISFAGPNGWSYSRQVVDPSVFDQLKVGDKVDFTWSTDLKVSVE